jgi:molybdopterin-synthase adenylyltransferase
MRRPRIKISHQPVRLGADRVRIGGVVHKLAFDVADADGWLWALATLLDGSRTVDEIAAELLAAFPGRPVEHVALAIEGLRLTGHLEDADEPEPAELTPSERERYSRSRQLFQWMDTNPRTSSWAAQLDLKRARVVVLGLGGVGSVTALGLVVSGVGHVHCVDRGVVALSDLNRQILYLQQDLGQLKVKAAVHRLRERNSDVQVTGEQRDIDGPETITAVAADFDVVVLTADTPPEIRSWTNQACHKAGIQWAWGGYDGPLMTTGLYRPGTGPCYDCAQLAEKERLAARPDRVEWPPAVGIVPPHAANITTVTITGSFVAHAVTSLLTGVPNLPANRIYQFNLVNLLECFEVGPTTAHPHCPTCGARN